MQGCFFLSWRRVFLGLFFILLFSYKAIVLAGNFSANNDEFYLRGRILDIKEIQRDPAEEDAFLDSNADSEKSKSQLLKVETEDRKIVEVENELRGSVLDVNPKKGDLISIYATRTEEGVKYFLQDFWRLYHLLFWFFLFFVSVLLLGGKSGLKALLSLSLSLLLIFFVLVPLVLKGKNAILVAIVISFFVTLISTLLILGFSRKSYAAILGTFGGATFASITSWLAGNMCKINGLGTEDARIFAVNFPEINFENIFFAGIMIGSLGAVMDTAVSISSGLWEVKKSNKKILFFDIYKSGMNIGKDILGSMLNTLIFAYVGASFSLVLLLSNSKVGILETLNYGFISEEIIRSIAGSFGLLLSIPLTSIFSAYFFSRE